MLLNELKERGVDLSDYLSDVLRHTYVTDDNWSHVDSACPGLLRAATIVPGPAGPDTKICLECLQYAVSSVSEMRSYRLVSYLRDYEISIARFAKQGPAAFSEMVNMSMRLSGYINSPVIASWAQMLLERVTDLLISARMEARETYADWFGSDLPQQILVIPEHEVLHLRDVGDWVQVMLAAGWVPATGFLAVVAPTGIISDLRQLVVSVVTGRHSAQTADLLPSDHALVLDTALGLLRDAPDQGQLTWALDVARTI